MTNPPKPPPFSKKPLDKKELDELRAADKKVSKYVQKVDDNSKYPA